jgi:hypothetical protein
VPLDRQKEIAEMYRAFPAHEVARAYAIPIRAVERIAARTGVRKRAPNGYHRIARIGPKAGPGRPPALNSRPVFRITAVAELELAASSLAEALDLAGTAGTTVRIVMLERIHGIRDVEDVDTLQQPPRGGPPMIQTSTATHAVSTPEARGR